MPTFNTFEMKQSFWKSVKYLWRYGIFAGTVYRLKVENFKSCRWAKFSPCHCKSKIPALLQFSAKMPTFNTFEMKQSFWISVKYLWRYGIFLGQSTGWKWKILNLVEGLSFHTCHCRSKIPARLKFSPQISVFQHVWDEAKFFKIG